MGMGERVKFKPFVPEEGYCRCRHRVKLNEDGSNPCRCCASMWPDDAPNPDDFEDDIGDYVKPRWVDESDYLAERARADKAEADLAAARAEVAALREALEALDVADRSCSDLMEERTARPPYTWYGAMEAADAEHHQAVQGVLNAWRALARPERGSGG